MLNPKNDDAYGKRIRSLSPRHFLPVCPALFPFNSPLPYDSSPLRSEQAIHKKQTDNVVQTGVAV